MWWTLVILLVVILALWWILRRNAEATEITTHQEESLEIKDTPVVEAVTVKSVAEANILTDTPASADDLELIEGIGPKIAAILKEAGIATFAQLAKEEPGNLKSILEKAGLRLGDPTTWPEQAKLAAEGNLEGLKALQDRLKGGRVVK